LLQCGIAFVGSVGVVEGLLRPQGGAYHHTPKTGALQSATMTEISIDWTALGEFSLLAIAAVASIVAIGRGEWLALPILLLYVIALGWMNAMELGQMVVLGQRRLRAHRVGR
jgi:hypothetical protein